jgi:diguanylate cyclase (GGDEF)-like protein/putative nucleotidyltransferase with HDIG domain
MPSTFSSLPQGAKLYVAIVTGLGAATIIHSLFTLIQRPIGWNWLILAVLTLVSGSATIKLPSLPATISVSETFVFTSVLLFGSAAGTMTVVLDALIISLWAYQRRRQPLYKSVFNVSALALTIWLASQLFFALADTDPLALREDTTELSTILGPLVIFTITYFALNSWIITVAISLERALPAITIWCNNFLWLSLNYFGGASVAALLVSYTKDLDFTYLTVIVPLLIVLYLTYSMSMGRVEDANRHLSQLNALYMSTIETLAMAIDAKDQITHGHIRRVQTYAVGLAKRMGVTDPELIQAIEAAALLHDMGKLAVPEYILNKPGKLTPAEFEKMKLHASVGADILSAINFPYPVVPIVRHHHENWNGSGYPDGVAGADIPIGARILSVVDCFDALTSDRPYRPRLTDRDALHILMERRGTMYDPLVVDTFIQVHTEITPPSNLNEPAVPLRAITDAAATNGPTSHKSGFDNIVGSTEEMLTLFNIAKGLASLSSLHDIGDVISKHLKRLIPSSLCVFYLYDADADEIVASHAYGENSGVVSGLRIQTGQRLSGWVAANRRSIRNSDPLLDLGEAARAISPRLRSCLSTPLVDDSHLVGVITLYSTALDAFDGEHQRVLEIVSRQVASVIRQAAEAHASRALAHDKVTGLPSLDQFTELANSQISAASSGRPVTLLLVNVRNIENSSKPAARAIPDDAVLEVVDALRRNLRIADVLFRYHGGEFVALLVHTSRETGRGIAERILSTLANERRLGDAGSRTVVRVGVASAPQDGGTLEELLQVANRLVSAPDPTRSSDEAPPTSIH